MVTIECGYRMGTCTRRQALIYPAWLALIVRTELPANQCFSAWLCGLRLHREPSRMSDDAKFILGFG
jgi:hypothetical protein